MINSLHFTKNNLIILVKNCYNANLKFLSTLNNGITPEKAFEDVIVEKTGAVTTFAINRSENKNELDENTYNELCTAINKFEQDDSSIAGVIYGIGGNFCSGSCGHSVLNLSKFVIMQQKPIVAALTGYATGFGFELALLCDLRVMEGTAQIGLNGFPTPMSEISYQRLVSVVGLSHALDLSLTGRNLQSREAYQCGLVNRLVDCGTGVGQAFQLAKAIAKFPISAVKKARAATLSVTRH